MKHTVSTLDNKIVEEIKPGNKDNPDNVKRVEFIVSEENFEDLFPRRHSSYTYRRLLQVTKRRDADGQWCPSNGDTPYAFKPLFHRRWVSSLPSVATWARKTSRTLSAGPAQPVSSLHFFSTVGRLLLLLSSYLSNL